MVVAGYLIRSPHIRTKDEKGVKFMCLPNGPPPINGRFTPSKLKERVELVFQLLPTKAKRVVIVNSTLSEFHLIQACAEVADKYAHNVMVIPPLLARLTYAREELSKQRNPFQEEVILVVTLTTKFVDYVILRRNENFELFVAEYEQHEPDQCEKMFQGFCDLHKPNSITFLVQESLDSVAKEIRQKFKPKNFYTKSFKKWDFILLHGGLLRAMNDEDGFDTRYHLPNFSSSYETLIQKPGTKIEEKHVLLPERSALPCNIYGLNGIPQKIKIFYSLEYNQRTHDFVSWRTLAARCTVKSSGSTKEVIGYVNERGIPYLTLRKNTTESGRKMTFVNTEFQRKDLLISHPKTFPMQSCFNTTTNSGSEIHSTSSYMNTHGQPEIRFIFRDNFYSIEIIQTNVTKVLNDSFGSAWTPLYLSMAEDTVKFGQEAKNHYKNFPQFVIYDVFKVIGKELNQIKIDPRWGFKLIENNEKVYLQIETLSGPRLFSTELVLSAFLKSMKLQTQSFLGNQNEVKEIQISTSFELSDFQKVIFEKAALKNNLSILSFVVTSV